MIFDFTPLPRSGNLARARLTCPKCWTSRTMESKAPTPQGEYRTMCTNCGQEGTFTTPSLEAMLVESPAG